MNTAKKLTNVIIGFSILIALWQTVIMIGNYEDALFPSPLKVGKGIWLLIANGTLLVHLKVSFIRFLIGYLSAVITAVILGLMLGRLAKLWNIIDPIVQILRPISPIAWSPFIVLWFGIGDIPAIVIIFIAAFFPVLLSTVSAVKKVDRTYLKVAENFEIKQPHLMTKIIFPAAFPFIANGLHIAIGTAWIFLVAGEMVGAQSGLGYLIVDARNSLRLDLVLAGIIFIGILGLILDKAIQLFERWIEKQWGMQPDE
ncbi:ABC transporter permease [Parageobacillus thermoglucosidasius]|uniref:ABC transporter permease n=2 Tax=Anoxybacillaceae TaxID=3120669 RepID=A0AB38R117_PARTM|nr:ABC transporter permease [Parageobacillus thermoglucosidasius]REK59966.1 MAG: ABC transporter permease [Geobacillus sp.]AEH48319.1 ABC-type transporter, integral membrane subunit [Parageobacillus thermoglucosidasius C56-YS93]UOE77726.1 ABC transporter permease [Parageobacillus thermoglucosidasius]BDG32516.1 ABC transporter permease [Parageobacillus thermoglucosidasius]GCD83001.1 sulfonate ABC transporter permease [Parageobacillus thermoglucosidasius]